MKKSTAARTAAFIGALGASAALVGAAVSTTGAYFTDSHTGQINAGIGHVRVNTSNLSLDYNNLLPGDYKTQTVDYTADGTGVVDVWLVFPTDGSASVITGNKNDGVNNALGRYGHLRITSPDGTFVSNNLSNPPGGGTTGKCAIDENGHGGSDRTATSAKDTSDPGYYVDYCAPANAILLQGNMPAGAKGSAEIEFGYTRILTGGQDAPSTKLANFKIVATQHGVRPDDSLNPKN